MNKYVFYALGFGVLALFDTLLQVSLKLASAQTGAFVMEPAWWLAIVRSPWLYGALVGYLGAFGAWMTLLKHAPVGPAFAASHLGIIPVLFISATYFGEHLVRMQLVGVGCIVLGIACLSVGEKKSTLR